MVNAILPGVYVNVIAGEREKVLGAVGVVTMPLELNWGDSIIILEKDENPLVKLGYKMSDVKLKLVKEVVNYANRLILYRLNTGEKAKATLAENVTATAIYGGLRGNDITVVVDIAEDTFVVKTFLDTTEVDTQIVKAVADFRTNSFVEITGEGTFVEATLKLTGGTNTVASGTAIDEYLLEMEKHDWNIMAYTGSENAVMQKLVTYINEQRTDRGVMVQAVLGGGGYDNKGIVNNTIGGKTLSYTLSSFEACATMAGIQAKCGIDSSATYYDVIGWIDVNPRLNQIQMETRTQNGEILFVMKYGKAMVLYDINSLKTYTDINPLDWRKNLIIRTLDRYAMELQRLLDTKAIGKLRNSVDGRNTLKGMISKMTTEGYLDKGYIEGFTAADITVSPAAERDSVTVTVGIKVVDTIDKIYITVTSL